MSALQNLIVLLWDSDDQRAFYSRFHHTRGGSGGSSYYLPLFPGHSRSERAEITLGSQLEVKCTFQLFSTPVREGGQSQKQKEITYLLTSTHKSAPQDGNQTESENNTCQCYTLCDSRTSIFKAISSAPLPSGSTTTSGSVPKCMDVAFEDMV